MNPIVDAAMKRAFILAACVFLTSLGGGLMLPDVEFRYLLGSSLVPAVGAFAARVIGEGWYDTNRAASGNVNKGDVAAASPLLTVTRKSTGEVVG
jgi:hypothetical protein